jgi:hypothetical protein
MSVLPLASPGKEPSKNRKRFYQPAGSLGGLSFLAHVFPNSYKESKSWASKLIAKR